MDLNKLQVETEILELSGHESNGQWYSCFTDENGKVVSPLFLSIYELFKWADVAGFKHRWVRKMPTVTILT